MNHDEELAQLESMAHQRKREIIESGQPLPLASVGLYIYCAASSLGYSLVSVELVACVPLCVVSWQVLATVRL